MEWSSDALERFTVVIAGPGCLPIRVLLAVHAILLRPFSPKSIQLVHDHPKRGSPSLCIEHGIEAVSRADSMYVAGTQRAFACSLLKAFHVKLHSRYSLESENYTYYNPVTCIVDLRVCTEEGVSSSAGAGGVGS